VPAPDTQTDAPTPATFTTPTPPAALTALAVGAERLDQYLPGLRGKRVALVVNHTATVGRTHLVDTLLASGIEVKKILVPEHGFRGEADAGEHVGNATDKKTGLPLISLYGSNKKPTAAQLADVDVVLFDIQDVGVRFYTYISTMHYVMEACAEHGKKLLVLDRPNPNGHYFDGPVLKPAFRSFVGMHPIPVVHGLTVGELARMINGEGWLPGGAKCDLEVVKAANYTHRTKYVVPVRPSPNLPNEVSIRLYPSICFFENTPVSVGRGTPYPFQVIGGTNPKFGSFTFTPVSTPGAKNPPLQGQPCYGLDLRNDTLNHFTLRYVLDFYRKADNPEKFFTSFFDKLAGTDVLRKQITAGLDEAAIRQSWRPELETYRATRKKYLLYAE
jgi:uncharacterized protein YbbC (DUF1343 family)